MFGDNSDFEATRGCSYYGDWKDNMRHGKGIFTWLDGSSYDGEWESNKRHGRGELFIACTNLRYSGYWENNQLVINKAGFRIFGT